MPLAKVLQFRKSKSREKEAKDNHARNIEAQALWLETRRTQVVELIKEMESILSNLTNIQVKQASFEFWSLRFSELKRSELLALALTSKKRRETVMGYSTRDTWVELPSYPWALVHQLKKAFEIEEPPPTKL